MHADCLLSDGGDALLRQAGQRSSNSLPSGAHQGITTDHYVRDWPLTQGRAVGAAPVADGDRTTCVLPKPVRPLPGDHAALVALRLRAAQLQRRCAFLRARKRELRQLTATETARARDISERCVARARMLASQMNVGSFGIACVSVRVVTITRYRLCLP
jgi:hypothetical protein